VSALWSPAVTGKLDLDAARNHCARPRSNGRFWFEIPSRFTAPIMARSVTVQAGSPPPRRRRTGSACARRARFTWLKKLKKLWPTVRARRRFARTFRQAPASLAGLIVGVLLVAVAFAVNAIYQVVRKPTELYFPVSGVLSKAPSETWRSYGSLFRARSTLVISPELLAALAQVEGAGNPVARTYWRWRLTSAPFEMYRPASSAVGMYQLTDAAFADARRFCIRDHAVIEDGPWNDWRSCWFNRLYMRVVPAHAVELTSVLLDRGVSRVLAHQRIGNASLQQKQDLAALIHLCGNANSRGSPPMTSRARLFVLLRGVALGVAGVLVATLLAVSLYALMLVPFTPSVEGVLKGRDERPSVLLAADGTTLTMFRRTNREWIKLERVPRHVVDALVVTEDHRFWEHGGVDWVRSSAAIGHTLVGDRQGGSTITQQLARNYFPEQIGRAQTINRKLKEMITAIKLERAYSKREILESYFNTVSFHYNAIGIEMAARTYFDKPATELNVLEGATLVGMLKGTARANDAMSCWRRCSSTANSTVRRSRACASGR
jgi:Transglycosylase